MRMKRKREAFVKNFSWFLLIPGLGLILTCRSWSQIRVSGLGHDIYYASYCIFLNVSMHMHRVTS